MISYQFSYRDIYLSYLRGADFNAVSTSIWNQRRGVDGITKKIIIL